jgi:hypothetical protein
VAPTQPSRAPRDEVRPLTADLRRLSVTVTAGCLEKLAAARTGLSHAKPHASSGEVLEAALDLLLGRQAHRKSMVQRPRPPRRELELEPGPLATTHPPSEPISLTAIAAAPPAPRGRGAVPAAVEREVRLRDGDRCQWLLDRGGVCGSTWQVELDHIVPVALGGPSTAANLRCACRVHNQRAAELVLGAAAVAARRRPR